MSTPIRATPSTHAAADVRRQEAHLHTHQPGAHRSAGHRGQFGGYVFRLGRAPAPPAARRPQPLRRRPPRPPGAQSLALEHDSEPVGLSGTGPFARPPDGEDQALAASLDMGGSAGHDDSHDPMRDGEAEAPYRALQWRLGQRDRPVGQTATWGQGMSMLDAVEAQALWQNDPALPSVHSDALARALVSQMLGVRPSVHAAPPQATRLQLAAVRAYLVKMHEQQLERGPLSTLAHVKQLLLDRGEGGGQAPGRALPDEAQQNLNLLLPLKLLNADRPRTPEQIQQACDRIKLSLATAPLTSP